jgi:hypothetical protein
MCGNGLTTGYEGQIMHQPAWSLFDAIRLAGIVPTATGFAIRPELPLPTFSVGLPEIGVAYRDTVARGYVVAATRTTLTMAIAPPAGRRWCVYANGRLTDAARRDGALVFPLAVVPGRRATWEIVG